MTILYHLEAIHSFKKKVTLFGRLTESNLLTSDPFFRDQRAENEVLILALIFQA